MLQSCPRLRLLLPPLAVNSITVWLCTLHRWSSCLTTRTTMTQDALSIWRTQRRPNCPICPPSVCCYSSIATPMSHPSILMEWTCTRKVVSQPCCALILACRLAAQAVQSSSSFIKISHALFQVLFYRKTMTRWHVLNQLHQQLNFAGREFFQEYVLHQLGEFNSSCIRLSRSLLDHSQGAIN